MLRCGRHAGRLISAGIVMVVCLVCTGLQSCGSAQQCATQPADGNLGSEINTSADEYSPSRMNQTLVFTSSQPRTDAQNDVVGTGAKEALFEALRRGDGTFGGTDINRSLPVNLFRGGTPTYCSVEDQDPIMMFPADNGTARKPNADLFFSRRAGGVWSNPIALDVLNSSSWDSQPALAPDGSYVVFASDRTGGTGGIDLYVSYRSGTTWTSPLALTSVNTPLDDITPSIDSRGTLYFASNGYGKNGAKDFNLMTATRSGSGAWEMPRVLPVPLNSKSDDVSPYRWGDTLVFASKRTGGCGGYDIYAMGLCAPVFLRGQVIPSRTLTRRSGTLTVLDSTGKFAQVQVPEDGKFSVKLTPNRTYMIRYINPCMLKPYEQQIIAPCNDSSTVVMTTEIQLPEVNPIFTFEEYNVPFFTSGYYQPNTTEQLEALRLKFAYNLLGVADSTRYIRDPQEEFNSFAPLVDSAIANATDFIIKAVEYRTGGCVTSTAKITVFVQGYVDPRPLSPSARYAGDTISDEEFGMYVPRGTVMTNDVLAQLRAYFTAKALQRRLMNSPVYSANKRWVAWRIAGIGADETGAPDTLKRRVELTISME